MTLDRRIALTVCAGLLIGLLLPAMAAIAGHSPPWTGSPPWAGSPPSSDSPPDAGRMTGGGRVVGPDQLTHGFELRCDRLSGPNRLQLSWGKGKNRHSFHLTELTSAVCIDDPAVSPEPPSAAFDVFVGAGVGRLDGDHGSVRFRFVDAGQPGRNDSVEVVVRDAGGAVVLDVSGTLRRGNHQAHTR